MDFKEQRKKAKESITDEQKIIGEDEIKQAQERMEKYFQGKTYIDTKAAENQEWWRQRHWNYIQQTDKSKSKDKKPASAWAFNSIANKHADIMDNFPKPNVLPREADDEEEARALSKIIPAVLARTKYQDTYDKKAYDYLMDGACITGIFWDNILKNGQGDISIKQINVHNIAWEPGIEDIQDSKDVFVIAPVNNDDLVAMYPQMEGQTSEDTSRVEYIHDDAIDMSDKSIVVDWYYKVTTIEQIEAGFDGEYLARPKTMLHYAKFCNGTLLYSSENEGMADGFYEHGKYPFVVRALFPIKDSIWGFGYIDVMRDPQTYIDALDQIISKNAFTVGNKRYAVKEGAGVNLDDFADISKPFIRVSGNIEDAMKPIETDSIPAFVVQHRLNKIDELKETSGNRDVSQGSTQNGVTAATAIAALQEAGSKLSRDTIRGLYRGHEDECYFVVELIRQFYDEPRSFRIDDGQGGYSFIDYSNTNLKSEEMQVDGTAVRRDPTFDIQIVAEKQSPFSRAAQNETAKEMYGMGLFNPQMAEPALVCLDMMDFEGKENIKKQVQQNSAMMQQMQAMAQIIQEADAILPQAQYAARAGLMTAQPARAQPSVKKQSGTAEERVAKTETDSTSTAKARVKAAKQSSVG